MMACCKLTVQLVGGGDKLQNFDLAKNHLTIGSDHKINDFCFLKFFISMKFDPHTIVILAENSSCLTAKVFSLASRAESIECKMKWIQF